MQSSVGGGPDFSGLDEAGRQEARRLLISGLSDAHALEEQALTVHRQQVAKLDDYPVFKERLATHIAETEAQVARLEAALERLDASPSSLKDTAMKAVGWLQSASQMTMEDHVIRAAIAIYGVKGFEIATYRALERLAAVVGDAVARADIEASLAEERAMAAWLDDEIGNLTVAYIAWAKRA